MRPFAAYMTVPCWYADNQSALERLKQADLFAYHTKAVLLGMIPSCGIINYNFWFIEHEGVRFNHVPLIAGCRHLNNSIYLECDRRHGSMPGLYRDYLKRGIPMRMLEVLQV